LSFAGAANDVKEEIVRPGRERRAAFDKKRAGFDERPFDKAAAVN